ncbi:MAG: oligosaccharide flippase family protein [Candidatus Binatia bacterium]
MADGIAGRALRGGAVLGVRQLVVQGANVLGIVALARLLSPDDFGLIAIATFVSGALSSVAALGLGTSLVRLPDEPVDDDLRVVLAAQHAVAVPLALGLWLLAPVITQILLRPDGETLLLRAVAIAVVLVPLQTVPFARLERRLDFARLASVEIVQALAFNVVAIAVTAAGGGTAGVALAIVLRALAGAVLATLLEPWRVGWKIDVERLRPLLRFGVPLQATTWISLVKDSLTPILLGATAGAAAVGLVDWAQMLATYPVIALMILQRVYVPAFARAQHDRAELGRLVGHAVQAANAVAAPIAVLTLVLVGPITDLVFGARWQAARELFYWLWCANLFVPTVTPLVGLLTATGRSRSVLALSLSWMAGTWLAGAPLVLWLGARGFAVANLAVQATVVWVVRLAREEVDVALLPRVLPPWLCAGAAGTLAFAAMRAWPPASLPALAAIVIVAGGLYVAALALVLPRETRLAWAALRGAV